MTQTLEKLPRMAFFNYAKTWPWTRMMWSFWPWVITWKPLTCVPTRAMNSGGIMQFKQPMLLMTTLSTTCTAQENILDNSSLVNRVVLRDVEMIPMSPVMVKVVCASILLEPMGTFYHQTLFSQYWGFYYQWNYGAWCGDNGTRKMHIEDQSTHWGN